MATKNARTSSTKKKAVTAKKVPSKNAKVPPKKPNNRQASPAPSIPPSLDKRLKNLERHVAALHGVASIASLATAGDARPLTFALTAGSAKMVRLTLLDTHESLILGTAPVTSRPRANGAVVGVWLETWGDPGQQATIGVMNATPNPLKSSTLQTSYLAESRTLRAQW
jgi:hypothetical protein